MGAYLDRRGGTSTRRRHCPPGRIACRSRDACTLPLRPFSASVRFLIRWDGVRLPGRANEPTSRSAL